MSKKIILILGGSALGDDLAGQMKAIKITPQAIVDLIVQGHEIVVTHGNRPQMGMINQAFEAAAKTEAHSPVLPMFVCAALSQGYTGCNLQNALREELPSRGINKPIATLVTQIEVDANDLAFLNPTKSIGSLFTEQETKQLTKQGYTLKEDAGRGYRRVVASPKPADIIEKEMTKALVDADQMMITAGSGGISVICGGNHPRDASAVINKDWANARLAEMIDADMPIILTAVGKVVVNFSKKSEQWLDRLSLSDAGRFIEEGHFAKGSMLPKVKAAVLFVHSCTDHETLIIVLSRVKEGIEGKTGMMTCQ